MTNARVIEQTATLYAEPNANTPVAEVPVGGEVQLGAAEKAGGKAWVAVALPDGRKGFLPGDAKVFRAKMATLLQSSAVVYKAPSLDSGAVIQLQKNARFELIDQVKGDGGLWVKLRDSAGNEGYIEGNTRVQKDEPVAPAAPVAKESATANMAIGALLCIAGIVITASTYSSASQSGGSYYIMYGPIIFGGWRFLKGLVQLAGE
jgi:hypothetical protein